MIKVSHKKMNIKNPDDGSWQGVMAVGSGSDTDGLNEKERDQVKTIVNNRSWDDEIYQYFHYYYGYCLVEGSDNNLVVDGITGISYNPYQTLFLVKFQSVPENFGITKMTLKLNESGEYEPNDNTYFLTFSTGATSTWHNLDFSQLTALKNLANYEDGTLGVRFPLDVEYIKRVDDIIKINESDIGIIYFNWIKNPNDSTGKTYWGEWVLAGVIPCPPYTTK
jgi:hypothetical protein